MQVKSEELSAVDTSHNHLQLPSPTQEMQCEDKTPSYSLWADYFDNFPVLSELDLRSGAAGSTGSSIASSLSASSSSESWSSPSSGSPLSDFGQAESPFDDHTVPNSVIDEIVQTLKMDGYNFDHLGDEILDNNNVTNNNNSNNNNNNNNTNSLVIKHEQDMMSSSCYLQNPVYTSLNPPKLQQHETRKYAMVNSQQLQSVDNGMCSLYDQIMDNKQWCTSTNTLPQLTLQQQSQQTQHKLPQLPPMQQIQPQIHRQESISSYTTSPVGDGPVYIPSFSTVYSLPDQSMQYKYSNVQTATVGCLPAPPPLHVQTSEKSTETKPRRRRSNNSAARLEKPHVCKECGASFKLSANLKQHQVIHTGEKPFKCEICSAMFTRLSSLKTHHRLHTGEKPHICPYCTAAFADRSAMKAHKRIHTGERPYKCQVCSTSFTQLSHLNAHKRTHTGEKPYACTVCGTTFKQLGHLKRHEKSHVCSRT